MFNKIIKSTMLLLLHSKRVNHDNKQELRRLIVFFSEVDLIELKNINWRGLHMELNSKSFRTLMNVCYLIINGLLLTTETGGLALAEYVDEQQTYKIFEKFILRYFQVEHPELRANAAYIGWNSDDGYIEFLPQMKSDIVLSFGGKKLIIDAKYYSKNMRKSQFGTKDVMISSNLYQIFTYVKNMDTEQSGKISGMLLYAHVDDNSVPDNDYMLSGNKIYIRSLDVNEDWSVIVRQLEDISKLIKAEQ